MITLRLLREAERYYRSGDDGLWHLSFRSACAVSAARHVYSEIGRVAACARARAPGTAHLCYRRAQSLGGAARRAWFDPFGAGADFQALVAGAAADDLEGIRTFNDQSGRQYVIRRREHRCRLSRGYFLAVQAGIVIASLLGYGIFTSRPDLLMQVDPQAQFFTWAFHGFAVGNMLFGGLAVVADALVRNRQTEARLGFLAVYVVSLASELTRHDLRYPVWRLLLHRRCSVPNGSTRVPLLIPLELVHHELGLLGDRAPAQLAVRRRSASARALLVAWDLLA